MKSESLAQYLTKVSIEQRRKLVKLEIDLIPQIRHKWEHILADRTTDRERAENAISACYAHINLEKPHILWAENPLNAIKILVERTDLVDVGAKILRKIWDASNQEIERQIHLEFIDVVKAYANPRAQIINDRQQIAFDPLGDFLNEVSVTEIKKIYPELDPNSLPATTQDYRIAYLSYFDYFQQIGLAIPQVQLLVDLATSCGYCWAFENIAILTPKPTAIEFSDSGELNSLVYDGINILA